MNDVITAGVDGTPESLSAILWAAHEARLRHARLRLLHAWVLLAPEPVDRPLEELEEGDQNYWPHRMMEEAVTAVRTRFPDLPVDPVLVPADPLEALQKAAGESDLLVLGSRDLGPVSRFALGELGLKLVAHTECPTVLVRARPGIAATGQDGEVVVGLGLHGPCEALLALAFDSAARRGPRCAPCTAGTCPRTRTTGAAVWNRSSPRRRRATRGRSWPRRCIRGGRSTRTCG